MGYGAATTDNLAQWLGTLVPPRGAVVELGDQCMNIEPGPPEIAALRRLVSKASRDPSHVDDIMSRHFIKGSRRIASAFESSDFTYRCVDICDGPGIIRADLNEYRVPPEWRGRFDLVTNFGTTEHILDQVNSFRVMHDFAKVGARFIHQVPYAGYFNHGLFAYTPAFFVFLAHANHYEIEQLDLTPPHLPYSIPQIEALPGSRSWQTILQQSGLVVACLRKTADRPFALFSDYDANLIGQRPLGEPWRTMIAERYDLRIRAECSVESKTTDPPPSLLRRLTALARRMRP